MKNYKYKNINNKRYEPTNEEVIKAIELQVKNKHCKLK